VLGGEIDTLLHGADWRVYQQHAVETALTNEAMHVWVAASGDTIVAFMAVSLDAERSIGELFMIAVDPSAQNHGLGTTLTNLATDRMRGRHEDGDDRCRRRYEPRPGAPGLRQGRLHAVADRELLQGPLTRPLVARLHAGALRHYATKMPVMTDALDAMPDMLRLDPVGEHTYEGQPEHAGDVRNVVFGGQILAQMIVAAHLDRNEGRVDDKEVKSIHAIFARAGDYSEPIRYEVDRMHDGRTLGSDSVTFSQRDRVMSRGLILWSKDEADLIRHTRNVEMPQVAGPDDPGNRDDRRVFPGAAGRIVDGINTWSDDEPLRDPLQHVWTRFDQDLPVPYNQAVLSWATDGYLIGTAMLPHEGFNEGQAHKTISTGVVSHTVNFHEPFRSDEWLLMSNESIWAGRGRTHGRCNIWTEDGRLVATYTQDNLVRGWADGKDTPATTTASCSSSVVQHQRADSVIAPPLTIVACTSGS
jgi:acyl-CoA thioesterase/GNAT superfamily N-acetyltransferase